MTYYLLNEGSSLFIKKKKTGKVIFGYYCFEIIRLYLLYQYIFFLI